MVTESRLRGLSREMLAKRVSFDIPEHSYVNLGIGIPGLISNWIGGRDIVLQAELGMLKIGPLAFGEEVDQDRVNASSQPVLELPGSSYFDSVESLSMIRGGHVDMAIMGAMQANHRGDFAGWANPARGVIGNIGGSMDLCVGARKLFIAMEHITTDGELKIVKELTYPATGKCRVNKIYTDLAVMEVTPGGLVLLEVAPGISPEQVQSVTEPKLIISHELKVIEV